MYWIVNIQQFGLDWLLWENHETSGKIHPFWLFSGLSGALLEELSTSPKKDRLTPHEHKCKQCILYWLAIYYKPSWVARDACFQFQWMFALMLPSLIYWWNILFSVNEMRFTCSPGLNIARMFLNSVRQSQRDSHFWGWNICWVSSAKFFLQHIK